MALYQTVFLRSTNAAYTHPNTDTDIHDDSIKRNAMRWISPKKTQVECFDQSDLKLRWTEVEHTGVGGLFQQQVQNNPGVFTVSIALKFWMFWISYTHAQTTLPQISNRSEARSATIRWLMSASNSSAQFRRQWQLLARWQTNMKITFDCAYIA